MTQSKKRLRVRKGSRLVKAEKHQERSCTQVHNCESVPASKAEFKLRRPTPQKRQVYAVWEKSLLGQMNGFVSQQSLSERTKHRSLIARLPTMVSRYIVDQYNMAAVHRSDVAAFSGVVLQFFRNRDHKIVALIRELYLSRGDDVVRNGRKYRGAWWDHRGKLRTHRPSITDMMEMLAFTRSDRPLCPVRRIPVAKVASGQSQRSNRDAERQTFEFSAPTRALQRMLLDVVRNALPPNAFDFARPGMGGMNGAARAIRSAILGGCNHFAIADIANAFPSMKTGHVTNLINLPKEIVHNIACPNTTRCMHFGSHTNANNPPQAATARCLPQGAIHSAAILSALLGRELRSIAGGHRVPIVVIVDDIAIGAQTRGEAKQALRTLRSSLASLSAGPLHLGRSCIQCPDEQGNHVQFGGYRHRFFDDTQRLHCVPSDKAISKMKRELECKLRKGPHSALEPIREKYFKAWARTFGEWTVNARSFEALQDTTEEVLFRVYDGLKVSGHHPSLWPPGVTLRSRRATSRPTR